MRARAVALPWLAAALLLAALAGPRVLADLRREGVLAGAMPSVVLVMAVDVRGGRLVARDAGSGTIVEPSGAVLTNHHLLHDSSEDRLFDLFVIGRFRSAQREPELVCAGRPDRAELDAEMDLALVRCEFDMSGRPWRGDDWPTLPMSRIDTDDVTPGEQIRVLGYPSAGNGALSVSAGLVAGWTGEHGGTASRAFMKTDASITHGNSGGAAIDARGQLLGIPTSFRPTTLKSGDMVRAGKVGLIRPIGAALPLVEAARSATEAPVGSLLQGQVVEAASGRAIEGAVVAVLAPDVAPAELSGEELTEKAITWGQSDAAGVFRTYARVPPGRSYSIVVFAPGRRPLVRPRALDVPEEAPGLLQPWPAFRLRR